MKLEELLRENNVEFETMVHTPVYTSQALAAADHVSGHCVAKPVIVRSDRGFAMCVVPASARLDMSRVARVLGDDSSRLATEAEMADACPDCELGAEPPIGRLFGLTTLMDDSLHEEEYLIFQAGDHTSSVKVRREDYERITSPVIDSIAYR